MILSYQIEQNQNLNLVRNCSILAGEVSTLLTLEPARSMATEDMTVPYTVEVEESQRELLPEKQLGLEASQPASTQNESPTLAPEQTGGEVPAGQVENTPSGLLSSHSPTVQRRGSRLS